MKDLLDTYRGLAIKYIWRDAKWERITRTLRARLSRAQERRDYYIRKTEEMLGMAEHWQRAYWSVRHSLQALTMEYRREREDVKVAVDALRTICDHGPIGGEAVGLAEAKIALKRLGYSCLDEGCPHYNAPHVHPAEDAEHQRES